MTVAEVVSRVEGAWLDGEKVRVRYPDNERHEELAGQIALLRRVEIVTDVPRFATMTFAGAAGCHVKQAMVSCQPKRS